MTFLLLLLLLGREAGDSYFHMYTFESSLADTTYLPSAVIEAEIWLLVFRNPVNKIVGVKRLITFACE